MGVFIRRDAEASSPTPLPYASHRPMTAAASKLNINDKSQVEQLTRRRNASTWQTDAWEYYDLIGEIKYAFRLFSNVLSRVRLYGAYITDENTAPSPINDISDDILDSHTKAIVQRAMRRAFGPTSQADVLRKASINILVAGECHFVQLPPKHGVRSCEQWKILSIDELQVKNDRYYYKKGASLPQKDWEEIPASTFMGRIWNEHARYADDADSSMKALVDLCDDLFLYTRAARASARSRLNAGILFVPDTLSVSADMSSDTPADLDVDPDDPMPSLDDEDDLFEQELIDGMTIPVSDESSVASIVPLLIRGPAEIGEKIKHIKLDRPFDPQIAQRAERALERILQGIDLPKDIVTGLANIKYSNAVQIEESLYTAHVEPVVLMLCDAFRAVYLVPALEAAGVDPDVIQDIVVWYDPSAIMTAPDKSNAANVGHDKFAISDAAWRRANGFADTDAPEPEEIARRLAVMRGQLNDATTEAIFRTFMGEILDAARVQSQGQSPAPVPPGAQQLLDGTVPGGQAPPDAGGLPPIVNPGAGSDGAQPPPPVPGS